MNSAWRRFSQNSAAIGVVAAWITCNVSAIARAQPANDSISAAHPLPTATSVLATLDGASTQPGEPQFAGISSGRTAWWNWTAPTRGVARVFVSSSNAAPFLNIYSGSQLPALSLVASNTHLVGYANTNCGVHWRFRDHASFHADPAITYSLQIDSGLLTEAGYRMHLETNLVGIDVQWIPSRITNAADNATIALRVEFTPAPANDDFAKATSLSGFRKHITADNEGASLEPGEPQHGTNRGGSSVWYSWTAPASGRVTISTNNIAPYLPPSWYGLITHSSGFSGLLYPVRPECGEEIDLEPPPEFFPMFAVYSGTTVESLSAVRTIPIGLSDQNHGIAFEAVSGHTYRIAFDGNRGTYSKVPLHLALTPPAANDDFASRIKIRGFHVAATGYNAGATRETDEPLVTANTEGKSVWWSWTAPVNAPVHAYLGGSDFAFPLGIFTAAPRNSSGPVASGTGSVTFPARVNETYHIAVSDLDGLTGAISLTVTTQLSEAELLRVKTSKKKAVMEFAAAKGQTLLLQRSNNAETWTDVRKSKAHKNKVSFDVSPKPGPNGPFYRAIILDQRP